MKNYQETLTALTSLSSALKPFLDKGTSPEATQSKVPCPIKAQEASQQGAQCWRGCPNFPEILPLQLALSLMVQEIQAGSTYNILHVQRAAFAYLDQLKAANRVKRTVCAPYAKNN